MLDDRELFKDAAWYYSRYRLGYPPAFFDHVVESFHLDKTSRALDLGTGTGQVAITMAGIAKEVVAVDQEKGMLDEGKAQASKKGVSNISWLLSKAEDVSGGIGTFKVTTIATAFHWMDQDKVLENVYGLTEPGGGVVIVVNASTIINNKGNDPWKDIVWATIKEFLGEQRRAGNSMYEKSKDSFEAVFTRSKFSHFKKFNDTYTISRSIDDIIGYLGSTSFASYRLFGDRFEEFKETLTERLLALDPSGTFIETAIVEAYLGWK
jgi:ubiquinone/menaquinone biosynthesis C-methylase UbiE